jgi:hypothetical protein
MASKQLLGIAVVVVGALHRAALPVLRLAPEMEKRPSGAIQRGYRTPYLGDPVA